MESITNMSNVVTRNKKILREKNSNSIITRKKQILEGKDICLKETHTTDNRKRKIDEEKKVISCKENHNIDVKKRKNVFYQQIEVEIILPDTFEYICKHPLYCPVNREDDSAVWDKFYEDLRKRRNIIRSHYLKISGYKDIVWKQHESADWDVINDIEIDNERNTKPLGTDFLANATHISSRNRYALIDLLVDWHQSYQMSSDTLHLAVGYFDRFTKKHKLSVKVIDMQILAAVCLSLASKIEDVYPIEIASLMSDFQLNDYDDEDIRSMEIKICETLNYRMQMPTVLYFLRYLNCELNTNPEEYSIARYFSELCLQDYATAGHSALYVSSACVFLTQVIRLNILSDFAVAWDPKLQATTGLLFHDINPIVKSLILMIVKQQRRSNYRTIVGKYTSPEYGFAPKKSGIMQDSRPYAPARGQMFNR